MRWAAQGVHWLSRRSSSACLLPPSFGWQGSRQGWAHWLAIGCRHDALAHRTAPGGGCAAAASLALGWWGVSCLGCFATHALEVCSGRQAGPQPATHAQLGGCAARAPCGWEQQYLQLEQRWAGAALCRHLRWCRSLRRCPRQLPPPPSIPAVLDLGSQPRLLYLSAGSSLNFTGIRVQGRARARRASTAAASATCSAASRHPRSLHSLRPHNPIPPGAGAAPPSAVLTNSSFGSQIVGNSLWPSVEGEPGHQLLFTNSSLQVGGRRACLLAWTAALAWHTAGLPRAKRGSAQRTAETPDWVPPHLPAAPPAPPPSGRGHPLLPQFNCHCPGPAAPGEPLGG